MANKPTPKSSLPSQQPADKSWLDGLNLTSKPAPAVPPASATTPPVATEKPKEENPVAAPVAPAPKSPVAPPPTPLAPSPSAESVMPDIPDDILAKKTLSETPDHESFADAEVDKLGEKAKKAFIAQRQELKRLKDELATKASAVDRDIVTRLETELKEVHENLARYDISTDPQFKEKFDKPLVNVIQKIQNLAKEMEIPEEVLKQAGGLPLRQRMEFLHSQVPEADSVLSTLFMEMDSLKATRDQAMSEAAQNSDQWRKQRDEEHRKNATNAVNILRDETLSTLREGGLILLKRQAGNDAWNNYVAETETKIQNLFVATDPREQAKMMAMGVVAETLQKLWLTEREKRLVLEKEKTGIASRGPRIGANGAPTESTEKHKARSAGDVAAMMAAKGPW